MATLRREGPPSQTDGRAIFHCLVESCNWTGHCTRYAADKHVAEKHPGRKASLRGQAADKKSVKTRYYQTMKEARQAERESERLPPEVLMLGTSLVHGLCCDVTPDGTGTRAILGNLAEGAKDSFQVAISWACLNASWLGAYWGGPPTASCPRRLFSAQHDLTLRVSDGELRKKGASSGACAGFALVKWLWSARETKTDVGVTGVIDLRGRLQAVGGIEEKTRTAKGEGDVRLMVMPEANFRYYAADDFAKVPEDLREFARTAFRGASTMLDVLSIAFPGVAFNPDAAANMVNGPQIGVARTYQPVLEDVMELECCLVKPGKGGVIMTGGLGDSVTTKECILAMKALAASMAGKILKDFGLPINRGLIKAHCDLHVHIPLWDRPLPTTDIQAPLLVALVSMLVGRRARRDSSAFGEVTAHGYLSSPLKPLTSRDVELCTQGGIRRLVVSEDCSVESEAEREACKLHPRDRKPTLELIRTENMLPVLHLFFEDVC